MTKVTILGAAGGIGQALALLLKTQLSFGYKISLYDINPVILGIAIDLSHIPTSVKIEGFSGQDASLALQDADIVIVAAGISRKPGMDRADLLKVNAGIVRNLIEQVAATSPHALICIITNPVNTIVPLAAKTLKKAHVYDKNKLFGVTTLDVIRANTFVANLKKKHSEEFNVTVIGGHSSQTIIPLLSQIDNVSFTEKEAMQLTKRIQNAGTEVVEAKNGHGSATLSMAQAAARFILSITLALQNVPNIIECAYVEGDGKYSSFFAQPLLLGKKGIIEHCSIGQLSILEYQLLDGMLETLNQDIKVAEQFIN